MRARPLESRRTFFPICLGLVEGDDNDSFLGVLGGCDLGEAVDGGEGVLEESEREVAGVSLRAVPAGRG